MNRRTVLQRGLALLAGLAGLDVVDPQSRLHAEVLRDFKPASPQPPLRLFARRWQTHTHGHEPGELPAQNGRSNRQGDLLSAIGGPKAGEFYATCFFPAASFGSRPCASANVELHTFKIGEDMLFGMGSPGPAHISQQVYAIIGGTGRFAGVRGSYAVTPGAVGDNRDYTEIVLTIAS